MSFSTACVLVQVHVYDMWYLLGLDMNGNIPMNRSNKTMGLLFLTKALFFWYNFFVPMWVFGLDVWTFTKCFVVMECVSGAWLAYFFQVTFCCGCDREQRDCVPNPAPFFMSTCLFGVYRSIISPPM